MKSDWIKNKTITYSLKETHFENIRTGRGYKQNIGEMYTTQ